MSDPVGMKDAIDAAVQPNAVLEGTDRNGPAPDPIKAEAVLQSLLAAGLQAPYGFDLRISIPEWARRLAAFDAATLAAACDEWTDSASHMFPSVGEIVSIALKLKTRQAEVARGDAQRVAGDKCLECDDERWVNAEPPLDKNRPFEHPVIETVRPCSLCMPEQFVRWHAGCFKPDHRRCSVCEKKGNR